MRNTMMRLSNFIKSNSELITSGCLTLYHMSTNDNIKQFVAKKPNKNRSAKMENTSVSRISSASDLNGCIIGYNSVIDDTIDCRKSNGKETFPIYYLYEFDSDITALKPNKKLVPDVDISNEYWILTHKPKFKLIAEFFFSEISDQLSNTNKVLLNSDNILFIKFFDKAKDIMNFADIEFNNTISKFSKYCWNGDIVTRYDITENEYNNIADNGLIYDM